MLQNPSTAARNSPMSRAEGPAIVGAFAAWVTACSDTADPAGLPAAFHEQRASAPDRRLLAVGAPAPAAGPVPSLDELMDWAERAYPQFFPSHEASRSQAPYVYRYYTASGNYLGGADGDVYVLGPVSGGQLVRVGSLAEFAPQVYATRFAFDDAQAARFLLQAQFAATDEDMAEVRRLGYEAWLQAQFAMPLGQTAWQWLQARGYGVVDQHQYYDGGAPAFDFAAYRQILSSPDGLRKRVQLALSELFSVSLATLTLPWSAFVYASFWDLLGAHALGNYRDLLEQVTLSAAMGSFLNTDGNRKEDPVTGRAPDENYAREVMQLFTIGLYELNADGTLRLDAAGRPIETYSNDDVTHLARVFTGYSVDFSGPSFPAPVGGRTVPTYPYSARPMRFDAEQHSTLEARFLGAVVPTGTSGPAALKIALDTLVHHPNVGPFIGRQLIQRLVTSDPRPAYVARVAAAFADNGQGVRGDLRAVVRAVLLDDEARGGASLSARSFGKLREPALRFAQWARTFRLVSKAGSWKFGFDYGSPIYFFGQRLFWPPTVFNFFRPGYVPPGTELAATQSTAPEFQIVDETSVAQYVNHLSAYVLNGPWIFAPERLDWDQSEPSAQSGIGDMVPDYAREMALAHDAAALVDRLNLLLCAGQLSARTRSKLVEALQTWPINAQSTDSDRLGRVARAVLTIMCCPEYLVQK